MHISERYDYRVFWSEEDQEYVGTIAEFPHLSYLAADRTEALSGIRELAKAVVESKEFDTPNP